MSYAATARRNISADLKPSDYTFLDPEQGLTQHPHLDDALTRRQLTLPPLQAATYTKVVR